MDWAVTVDLRTEADLVDDDVDTLIDTLHPDYGAALAVGGNTVSATMTIEGPRTITAAANRARQLLGDALAGLGHTVTEEVSLEAMTTAEQDRRLDEPFLPPLAGVAEAAETLGVSKQRIYQLASDNPRFPDPVLDLRMGPVWLKASIEAFARARAVRRDTPIVTGSLAHSSSGAKPGDSTSDGGVVTMADKKPVHTVKHGDGWANRKEGASRVSNTADTKKEAQAKGRDMAKADKVEHVIHNADGKIGEKNSYGNDPPKIKG